MKTLLEFIEDEKVNIDRTVLNKIMVILEVEWVYITKEIVQDMFGYAQNKSTMVDFYKKIKTNCTEYVDYKEATQKHELVINSSTKLGNRAKCYLMTPRALMIQLMRANTVSSLRYAEYFYSVHDLMTQYYKFQAEELKALTELPHIKEYSRLQGIKYLDLELQNRGQIGLIYFIHEEFNTEVFKVGFTTNLLARLECLQISNSRKLLVYRTIHSSQAGTLESIIHSQLTEKQIRGEWYKISGKCVDEICNTYDI